MTPSADYARPASPSASPSLPLFGAAPSRRRVVVPAFTLIELLVVIAVIALLIGILLPSLGAARLQARATTCGSRLQQIGVGLSLYMNQFDNTLPQAKGPLPEGGEAVIGTLFAGKKGRLPFYAIDQIGAERRPLNRYVIDRDIPPDEQPGVAETPEFRSPCDRGAESTGVPIPGLDRADSMYTLTGSSYILNDHALDGEERATLVPRTATGDGGRMPVVTQPTRTWVVGTHPIYNYQQDGDRGMRWYGKEQVEANLLFVDLHARVRVPVPKGVVNTTRDYTFLP